VKMMAVMLQRRQFGRYLGYALNSASELEYHLIVARDTRIIRDDEFATLVAQTILSVRKMLYTLIKRLPTSSVKRVPTDATPKGQ
jgi:four helix bundle protein